MKKIIIFAFMMCVLRATNEGYEKFPDDNHPLLNKLSTLCDEISSVLEGSGQSCFISRAYPRENYPNDDVLLTWCDKINLYLDKAGIKTFYDTNENRGLQGPIHAFMNEISNVATVLVILTPGYKANVENRQFVNEEIVRIKEKSPLTRFVLLAGSLSNAVPEEFQPLGDNLYYPAISQNVRCLSENSGPDFNRFLEIICDLLDPKRNNLLRSGFDQAKAHTISSLIDIFRKELTLPIGIDEIRVPLLLSTNSYKEEEKSVQIDADIRMKDVKNIDVKGVDQEGDGCNVIIAGVNDIEASGDVTIGVVFQKGDNTQFSFSGKTSVVSGENVVCAFVDQQSSSRARSIIRGQFDIRTDGDVTVGVVNQTFNADRQSKLDKLLQRARK